MVNVLDVEQAHLEEIFEKDYGMDRLKLMFNRQRELMAKYHDIEKRNGCLQTEDVPVDLNSTLGQQRLKDLNSRVCEELYEAAFASAFRTCQCPCSGGLTPELEDKRQPIDPVRVNLFSWIAQH